ncbi:MAG: hypothetical protein RMJ98_00005, partial [Myxococcales bacterium]|nr:hypothetical protein [Polyangiaceae bacterium]MDW8247668.1 hypothetical protein [Myxococcales bacterium]
GPPPLLAVPDLLTSLARRGAQRPLLVGIRTPPPGVTAPVEPCRLLPAPGQLSRYPVAFWKAQGIDAVVLLGPPRCAQDVLEELRSSGVAPRVALGLEAATLLQPAPRGASLLRRPLAAVAAGLGCFPERGREAPPEGVPGYWERLASEALLAAVQALDGLPEASTRDAKEVRQRKGSVREALAHLPHSRCLGLKPSPSMNPPAWRLVEVGVPPKLLCPAGQKE